jgi:2-polyprenyl-3-methyl-5-hydroxy-6-metoxy-1,4-benzoquinol methylase
MDKIKFNNSYIGLRLDLIKHINRKGLNILDIGCATGTNGMYLFDNKICDNIVGVEINSEMAKVAANHYDKVFVGDLNNEIFLESIISESSKFDVILIGDVLEHLIQPKDVLIRLKESLKKNGKIIFSVPNIQHIDAFIHIFIKGYFPLNERGIFDKTHLRWFTLLNIKEMLIYCNLKIIKTDRNFRYRDAIGSTFPFYKKLLLFFFKKYYTFQYIIVCEKE